MLNATKSYVGPVLFLEDDYYVSPDFYHMLRLLYDRKMRQVLVKLMCVLQVRLNLQVNSSRVILFKTRSTCINLGQFVSA